MFSDASDTYLNKKGGEEASAVIHRGDLFPLPLIVMPVGLSIHLNDRPPVIKLAASF